MKTFAYRFVFACAACLWAATGVLYDDPAGGWLYTYEGSVTYLRIQDPGDPRNQFFPA